MQTMSALLRIAGSLEMTVPVYGVTPAEALLLMHIHDPATKDAFDNAKLTGDVTRSKVEERSRLHQHYAQHKQLIDHLFPGRNASDVPETFAELEDVPLEVAREARIEARRAVHDTEVTEVHATTQEYAGGKRKHATKADDPALRALIDGEPEK